VNPLQFGPGEDFSAAPPRFSRPMPQQQRWLGVAHACLHPSVKDLFPGGEAKGHPGIRRTRPLWRTLLRPIQAWPISTALATVMRPSCWRLIRPDRLLSERRTGSTWLRLAPGAGGSWSAGAAAGCPPGAKPTGLAGQFFVIGYLSPAERQRASAIPAGPARSR